MAQITKEQTIKSYDIGKAFYENKITWSVGVETLVSEGMSIGSAKMSIYDFTHYMRGVGFRSTKNLESTQYFMKRFYENEGLEALNNAVMALEQHIIYYESKSNAKVVQKRVVLEKYQKIISESNLDFSHPEDINDASYIEGSIKKITINSFERDRKARNKCLELFGYSCAVCDFNFQKTYGEIGKEFIHVHHRVEISSISASYMVNPKEDLVPVCPNCHAMLHKKRPAYTVSELREILESEKVSK